MLLVCTHCWYLLPHLTFTPPPPPSPPYLSLTLSLDFLDSRPPEVIRGFRGSWSGQ